MAAYNKTVKILSDSFIKDDIKARRKNGLSKRRSDTEAGDFRTGFDGFHNQITQKLNRAMQFEADYLSAPEPLIAKNSKELGKFLTNSIELSLALAEFMNYATNYRGTEYDKAKYCNLLAVGGAKRYGSSQTKNLNSSIAEFIAGYMKYGFVTHLSIRGTAASNFWAWLLFDPRNRQMDFQVLLDIAGKTARSDKEFIARIADYCMERMSFG